MKAEKRFYEMDYERYYSEFETLEHEIFKIICYEKEISEYEWRRIKFLITNKAISLYTELRKNDDERPLQLTENEIVAICEQFKELKEV